jgi:hypothetical protein
MARWKISLIAALIAVCPPVLVQAAYQGTAKERAACRPDVRKFCHTVKAGSGSGAFLNCLQANRPKLSKACRNVLERHGQ